MTVRVFEHPSGRCFVAMASDRDHPPVIFDTAAEAYAAALRAAMDEEVRALLAPVRARMDAEIEALRSRLKRLEDKAP